jgi:carboxyl-terminal processing protease
MENSMKKISLILFLILITTVSCSAKYRNLQSFETVWQTVNKTHYDPTFGGVDWDAVHERYAPKIAAAKSDSEFYVLTNRLLFELNLSHLLVATKEDLKKHMPILFAEGTVGLDVRWMGEAAVITGVKPGTPADSAGLRPGYTIEQIDGRTITQIVSNDDLWLMPPFNSRNRRNNLSNYLLGHIYGSPDTIVKITYRDESENIHESAIKRKSRGRGRIISPAMPPAIIEFEAKRMEGNLCYIRFNHFAEPVDTKFIAALNSMRDARGLIIDLRGNPGGYFSVLDTIAEHLLSEKVLLYQYKFRDRTVDKVLTPVAEPFKKPVVVLIDEKSMSCSELFAGSMQAVKRVIIAGDRSPGYLLGANWIKLQNGGSFMHTILQPLPSNDKIIEDNGVTPDIAVGLDRDALLDGRDTQLEAAADYIIKNN